MGNDAADNADIRAGLARIVALGGITLDGRARDFRGGPAEVLSGVLNEATFCHPLTPGGTIAPMLLGAEASLRSRGGSAEFDVRWNPGAPDEAMADLFARSMSNFPCGILAHRFWCAWNSTVTVSVDEVLACPGLSRPGQARDGAFAAMAAASAEVMNTSIRVVEAREGRGGRIAWLGMEIGPAPLWLGNEIRGGAVIVPETAQRVSVYKNLKNFLSNEVPLGRAFGLVAREATFSDFAAVSWLQALERGEWSVRSDGAPGLPWLPGYEMRMLAFGRKHDVLAPVLNDLILLGNLSEARLASPSGQVAAILLALARLSQAAPADAPMTVAFQDVCACLPSDSPVRKSLESAVPPGWKPNPGGSPARWFAQFVSSALRDYDPDTSQDVVALAAGGSWNLFSERIENIAYLIATNMIHQDKLSTESRALEEKIASIVDARLRAAGLTSA